MPRLTIPAANTPASAGAGASPLPLSARAQPRQPLAAGRAALARAGLARCLFCAHECGVNRLAGETGPCQAGTTTNYFTAQIEVSDESVLAPVFAIALGGCDIRCRFCITRQGSWNVSGGLPLEPATMAQAARSALRRGARTIMILGGEPTIHLHSALELVSRLPEEAVLVWKTNGRGAAASRALLADIFDYWVIDYKFGNDSCARRLSGFDACLPQVHKNLLWAAENSRLIIRHLLMPGHVACCWEPSARWIAGHLPQARVNLRTGFWPVKDRSNPELSRTIHQAEAGTARDIARDLKLNLVV